MLHSFYKHIILLWLVFISFVYIYGESPKLKGTDGLNRTIELSKVPNRIISLGAGATEILFELGAEKQIAAVSYVSDYPPEAKNLPSVGGFDSKTISLEKIISYKPDFIILYKGMHDFLFNSLDKFKIPYFVSDAYNIEEIVKEIKNIGILTGHQQKALELEIIYKQKLSEIKKIEKCPKIYYEVWNSPYMSVGKYSFIDEIISASGGENIFSHLEQAYPVVSEEAIIAGNPDFILIPRSANLNKEIIGKRTGWNKISAVLNNKVIIVDDDIYTRAGPRIFDAIEELGKLIYEE